MVWSSATSKIYAHWWHHTYQSQSWEPVWLLLPHLVLLHLTFNRASWVPCAYVPTMTHARAIWWASLESSYVSVLFQRLHLQSCLSCLWDIQYPPHRPSDQADGTCTEVSSSKTMASQFEEVRVNIFSYVFSFDFYSNNFWPCGQILHNYNKNIHRLGEAYSEVGNYESSSVYILDKAVSHCPYTVHIFGRGLLVCHR